MSQRDSGYARIEFDQYETPGWVTGALLGHIPNYVDRIWEPACGSGKMVTELLRIRVTHGTDIQNGGDFLAYDKCPSIFPTPNAIITNPPYKSATQFISHALELMKPYKGCVAMLLRCDFDHAKSRANLFANHDAFAKKLVLTKRIKWIDGSTGSPSFNHAWYIWDWRHRGMPVIAYDINED